MNVMKQNNFQAIMNFGIVEIITNYGEMPNSAEILNLLQIEQAKLTAQKNYMILGGDLKLAGDCCALKDVKEQEPHQSKWRNMKLAKKKYERAEGTFTQFPDRKECKPSILDLVILEEEMYDRLTAFVVDENNMYNVPSCNV